MNTEQTIQLYQPMLQSIALRMLRCKADAEDVVQETFIKWLNVDHNKVENTKAYLIRAISNTCLNHLNSLRKKKEEKFENLLSLEGKNWSETDISYLDQEEDLSQAFSVVFNKLEPLERAVFLLKEIFNLEYEELQGVVDKKQEHCRQLLCRARKKINEEAGKISNILPKRPELFNSFSKACYIGEIADFISELKKDLTASVNKK